MSGWPGSFLFGVYLFQRRTNIATEAGHAGHGAGLASASLPCAAQLSPRVHAVGNGVRAYQLRYEPRELQHP